MVTNYTPTHDYQVESVDDEHEPPCVSRRQLNSILIGYDGEIDVY